MGVMSAVQDADGWKGSVGWVGLYSSTVVLAIVRVGCERGHVWTGCARPVLICEEGGLRSRFWREGR